MKRQNRIRQLHLDGRLTLRLQLPDNGLPPLSWHGCRQSCSAFEGPIQIELCRRIIPIGYICPESPHKLTRGLAFGRMLELPGWLAHAGTPLFRYRANQPFQSTVAISFNRCARHLNVKALPEVFDSEMNLVLIAHSSVSSLLMP